MTKCMLNNTRMNLFRREQVYQAVLIDLALAGAVDKKLVEAILGYEIPDYIKPLVEGNVYDDASADERLSATKRRTRD